MAAQTPAEAHAGSELESYWRALQVSGAAPLYPWTLRGFGPRELDRLAPQGDHPWRARAPLAPEPRLQVIRPAAELLLNTGFPYGRNDGAVWAGRGVTAAVHAGVAMRWGPVSLTLAPVAFYASNAAFPLIPNGRGGDTAFGDPSSPLSIDRPQRFGPGAYATIDPGQSTLRVDFGPIALGLSTASQVWGPGVQFPLILGAHAAGYPHAFIGTAHPLNIGLGRLHGRVVYGQLRASRWFMKSDSTTSNRRYAPSLVAVFQPRGLTGLELGATRFFHARWPDGGLTLRDLLKPFEAILKQGLVTDSNPRGSNPDNQLASAFARWVFPASGFEAYFEFGREDHNRYFVDFLLEPDHASAYLLGAAKTWRREDGALLALRVEVANAMRTQLILGRGQPVWYRQARTAQGHTYRGQVLGSEAIHGGAGSSVRLDHYSARGRWSVMWTRELVAMDQNYLSSGTQRPRGADVLHTVGAERMMLRAPFDVTVGAAAVQEFNRDFGRDAFNLNATLRVRLVR